MTDFEHVGFGDLFNIFFGGGMFDSVLRDAGGMWGAAGGSAPAPRGDDVEARLDLTFAESVFGVTKDVEVTADATCETCGGSGAKAGTGREQCPQCHGSGRMREVSSLGGFGQFIRTSTCNVCRGQGTIVKEPCETCLRHGPRAPDAHACRSTCPPASPTGSACGWRARAAPAPTAAGPATCTSPSPSSRTRTSCATATTSSTGSTSPWSTRRWAPPPTCPRSTATSRCSSSPARSPARSRSYRSRGVPVLQGYGRGDLKVVVNVLVPRKLTDEQRELLEQFAELSSETTYEPDQSFLDKVRAVFRQ